MPRIGAILIGDELLSGRRQDSHLATLIGQLATRGMQPSWVHMIGDELPQLTQLLMDTMASDDIVFCYGGIGATPDDCTRQAAAAAAQTVLERHPQGADILMRRYGGDITDQRLAMVDFPQGARLIPNPVNEVPGFSVSQHHFVPGFPKMATPMVQWVLDNEYPALHQEPPVLLRIRVDNQPESRFVDLMERLGERYPSVKISSLPNAQSDEHFIEFGFTGIAAVAKETAAAFRLALQQDNVAYLDLTPS